MATSTFQLYIDKENTGVPIKTRDGSSQPLGVRGVGLTPSVKSFAGNDSSLARTGPRSALKDVNNVTPQAPLRNKKLPETLAPVQELFKVPAPKDNDFVSRKRSDQHQKSKLPSGLDGRHRVVHKNPDPLPEKEQMFIFKEAEELQPRLDPDYVGIVEKIRRWRPACFFGGREDSESEDETIDDFDIPPPPEPKLDVELELVEIDEVDFDIPIPNIDKDLPIPFLDDSLDIEPNLGTLEIYHSSTPLHLSPSVKK